MSNLHNSYTKILSLLHALEPSDYYLNPIRLPKLSDKELMALSLAAEGLEIDSERYLFKRLPRLLQGKIDRSICNRRRRHLNFKIEQFRKRIAEQIVPCDSHHMIDSMALEIGKFSRAKRTKICRDCTEVVPNYDYCAAQRAPYFAYKFHAVCTSTGVFKAFDITRVCVHDLPYLHDVKAQFSHCVLIGDRGYLSRDFQSDLFKRARFVWQYHSEEINTTTERSTI